MMLPKKQLGLIGTENSGWRDVCEVLKLYIEHTEECVLVTTSLQLTSHTHTQHTTHHKHSQAKYRNPRLLLLPFSQCARRYSER